MVHFSREKFWMWFTKDWETKRKAKRMGDNDIQNRESILPSPIPTLITKRNHKENINKWENTPFLQGSLIIKLFYY